MTAAQPEIVIVGAGPAGMMLAYQLASNGNVLVPRLQRGDPVDAQVLQQIQDERQPEIAALQKGQTRAAQMVMKPAPVLLVMMTMLGLAMTVMGRRIRAGHGIAPPVPKYLTPVKAAGA